MGRYKLVEVASSDTCFTNTKKCAHFMIPRPHDLRHSEILPGHVPQEYTSRLNLYLVKNL